MHELSITQGILKTVLRHAAVHNVRKVVSIRLQIGKFSDLEDEWIQKYFDYLSKGTIAEGAALNIERLPIVMQCRTCNKSFEADIARIGDLACPTCGAANAVLVAGREYTIKDMEVL